MNLCCKACGQTSGTIVVAFSDHRERICIACFDWWGAVRRLRAKMGE